MKKHSTLLLFAAGVLLLTGCQSESDTTYSKYVTLGDYTGMTIDRITTTVTDEDVQSEIESNLYFSADYNEVTDRAAQDGDTVNIDYAGTIDGEEFDGSTETDCELELGTETFLADFENEIIGMEIGETKVFDVTFPEDYDGIVDGQTAEFTVTLNSITETILPEYTDEWVQENTDYSSMEEYEAGLKDELQEYYDEEADYSAEYDALAEVVSNATFDGYPEDLYNTTLTQMESENEAFAEQLGMEVEELFGEDYDIDTDVIDSIHEQMVVYTIAEKEDLEVTDDEYQTFVDDYWELYGYESADEFVEDYTEESIRYQLVYDKVLEFLKENNTFQDIDEDEYYGTMEEDEEDLEEADLDEEDLEEDTEASLDEESSSEADDQAEDSSEGTGDTADAAAEETDTEAAAETETVQTESETES